ncbi:hypothetical protein DRW07_03715 [Alteromonas sediminis]|uniref:PEP-CTERM sorting domain-containing protein n=1 Tax=Alteromonas sediminis TaxID=2259342 RepID=A0A3N5Y5L2_9ALTE|nr:hypothetical protein [Alteromonas sediminis]RPJ68523.1 hypothetical protein DRW07_03715 [Alteromonas sediminis]
MKNKLSSALSLLAGAGLMAMTSFSSQAAYIVSDNVVTGDEMAGIQVSAYIDDVLFETFTWQAINTVPGTSGNEYDDAEELSGGVSGTGWSLEQEGFTLGECSPCTPEGATIYGAWSFFQEGANINKLVISTVSTSGDLLAVFDNETAGPVLDTLGSGTGRGFFLLPGSDFKVAASYNDQVEGELFSSLTLEFASNAGFSFWADTDLVEKVSAPHVFSLLGLALAFSAFARRKRQA